MQWYKINFSASQVNDGCLTLLVRQLQLVLSQKSLSAEDRSKMAYFKRSEKDYGESRSSDSYETIYITPTLAGYSPRILNDFKAEPCDQPLESSVGIMSEEDGPL